MNEDNFKEKLNPEQYRVMRQKGTEVAHTGKYYEHKERGIYLCAACKNIIFLSLNKFDAKNGWPSFTRPVSKKNIVLTKEADGRLEVSCKECASHLGYIERGDDHYTINSIALDFQELPDIEWGEEEKGEKNEKEKNAQQTSGATTSSLGKTLNLTIGGLTLGLVTGAGATYMLTPAAPMCPAPTTQTATQNLGTPAPVPPSTQGGVPVAPVPPRTEGSTSVVPAGTISTPPPSSDSSAGGSATGI